METMLKRSYLPVFAAVFIATWSMCAFAQEQENQENGSLVGRIAYIEGQLLRYMPEEDDWVLTDQDTPFGQYDNVFSSEDGKAEIIMPNNTLLRIGGDTQVQLIDLTSEVTEIDVSSGTARLYNRSSSTTIKATTPFGDVIMPPETICDIYVHETQAEVVSLKGSVEFIQSGNNTRQEVIAGSSSIIVNAEQIIASAERVVPAWNSWNVAREAQWRQRTQARGESTKYLPENLQDNAVDLDTNGRWERVYYDGAYNYYWRPSYVSVDWTPFSSGRWIVWHGDHTWVPAEPFGYVTHHYGNWVYVGNYWYWAPPAYVGMYWYPGRVAWVSSGISIGWFPLAPFETYYCNNYWGPWSRVRHYNHYYDCRKYRHHRHARFIDHHRFYGSRNYRHAGLRKEHSGEKFRGSARLTEKMRRNFKTENKHRYASNIPKFRDTVKKINVRGDKRIRQVAENRQNANPFKRTIGKGIENNRSAGRPMVENTSQKVVQNNKPVEQRLSANTGLPKALQENKGKTNSSVTTKMQTRKESAPAKARSFQQPSKKMAENRSINQEQVKKPVERTGIQTAGNRRTTQASFPQARQNTRQKFDTGGPSRNLSAKNTAPDRNSLPGRSTETLRVNRPNTNSTIGTAYTRSTGQQRVQQNSTGSIGRTGNMGSTGSTGSTGTGRTGSMGSTGRMQGYSGRGR